MSVPEFTSHANMLENVVNTRGKAGANATAAMIDMSRAGLGDFSALLGNVAGLNQVSGGQNNIEQLKSVLGAAVALGFDRSRVAQQFVQTSTSVADSLKLTRVDLTSAALSDSVKWQSATGKADERALRNAATGMEMANQFTGTREGVGGASKMFELMKRGVAPGEISLLLGVNTQQALEARHDIAGFGNVSKGMDVNYTRSKKVEMITNAGRMDYLRSKGLMEATPEKQYAALNTDDATAYIQKYAQDRYSAVEQPYKAQFEGLLKSTGRATKSGQAYADEYKALTASQKGKSTGSAAYKMAEIKKKNIRDIITESFVSLDQFQGDERGAGQQAIYTLQSLGGMDQAEANKSLSLHTKATAKRYADSAQQVMSKTVGEIYQRTMKQGGKPLDITSYSDLLSKGAISEMSVDIAGKSVTLTPEVIAWAKGKGKGKKPVKGLDGVTAEQIEAGVATITPMEAMRAAEFQASAETSQKVWIENASAIADAIVIQQKIYNMAAPDVQPKGTEKKTK
jgi:hypothetical protein